MSAWVPGSKLCLKWPVPTRSPQRPLGTSHSLGNFKRVVGAQEHWGERDGTGFQLALSRILSQRLRRNLHQRKATPTLKQAQCEDSLDLPFDLHCSTLRKAPWNHEYRGAMRIGRLCERNAAWPLHLNDRTAMRPRHTPPTASAHRVWAVDPPRKFKTVSGTPRLRPGLGGRGSRAGRPVVPRRSGQ